MTTDMRCGECRYWRAVDGEAGKCHRHPPRGEAVIDDEAGTIDTVTVWPITEARDFCGEFTQRIEGEGVR